MKSNLVFQMVATAAFIVASLLLLNPMDFWMGTMAQITALGGVVVACGALLIFILKERAEDERDDVHRMLAGRYAFFAGSLALLIGIILQSESGHLDPWLMIALIAMVVVKIGTRMWTEWYK